MVKGKARKHHLHMGLLGGGTIAVHHGIHLSFEVTTHSGRGVDDQFHFDDVLHVAVLVTLHQVDPDRFVGLVGGNQVAIGQTEGHGRHIDIVFECKCIDWTILSFLDKELIGVTIDDQGRSGGAADLRRAQRIARTRQDCQAVVDVRLCLNLILLLGVGCQHLSLGLRVIVDP